MKNKKQCTPNQNSHQEKNFLISDNPTLNGYYISISQFLNKINIEDPSFSFNDELLEIIDEAAKISNHDANSLNPVVLDANWRSLSNQILFHVQQINQRNQSSKILQYVAAIKEIITYTNEVPPIAQAAKKEHHNVYVIIKKAISHIEQSVQLNDSDRTSLLLHNFKNDLPKTYTKFFQLSQLDRAASITAMQDCKKNVDQILRVLAGTNQLYVPPIEFQSLTRFINQLKLKSDIKKPINSTQRSKTPPARIPKSSYQKNYFTNTMAFSPPALEIPLSPDNALSRKYADSPSSARKVRTSKNQAKEITVSSHYKAMQASNDKFPSRSRTPPSKILSSTFSSTRTSKPSPSNIPTRRNQTTDNNKSSENSPHQRRSPKGQLGATTPLSLQSTKNRKNSSQQQNTSNFTNETAEKDNDNYSKIPSKRKSELSSTMLPPNETQKRKIRNSNNSNNSSPRKSSPFSPISFLNQPESLPSKKNLSRTQNLNTPQNLNQPQNLNKKKEQGGNLISTAVNIDRSILQESVSSGDDNNNTINLKSAMKIPKSQSSLSQDSETDQLVMAVKKAKEQVKHLSPTLEKLQRDLSGLFYKDDSTSPLSPSSDPPNQLLTNKRSRHHEKRNIQKIDSNSKSSNDNDDSMEVEIDIDEGKFSPRSTSNRDEMKSKTIHSFDSRQCASVSKYSLTTIESCYQEFLLKLNQFDGLIEIGNSIKKFNDDIKEGNKDSIINAELTLSKIDEAIASHHSGALAANEASLQIGRAISSLNKKLDEVETGKDSLLDDYEKVLQIIDSSISSNMISGSQQTNKLFMEAIKVRKTEFEAARTTIQSISKRDSKGKKKMKNKSGKNKRKKEGEEEILNANKLLEDEIEKLTIELSNLNEKEKLRSNSNSINQQKNDEHNFTENLADFDVDEKLNEMSFSELDHVRNELEIQLSEMQEQHENQLLQLKKAKEDSFIKENESRSELENISKQISEANKALLLCNRNKTAEFQSKTIQREELQDILMNLIARENQIIQNMISNS